MKRLRFVLLALANLAVIAPTAETQAQGIEIIPTAGYRFSGTLSSNQSTIGYAIDKVKVPDAASYGLSLEFPFHPNGSIEAMWSHQLSHVDVTGRPIVPGVSSTTTRVADLSIDTIQAGVLWVSGRPRDRVRGWFDILVGASILAPSNATVPMSNLTRISASLGGGVKLYVSDNLGFKLGGRWMPVYINSGSSDYVACDPYWGCYTYYNTQYLQQIDLSAGLIIRF